MIKEHNTAIEILDAIEYFKIRIATIQNSKKNLPKGLEQLEKKYEHKLDIFNRCIERLEQRHFKVVKEMFYRLNVCTMDYSNIDNIEVDGIDFKDHPDYCDAYISSADYNGVPMTESQLDSINEDGSFVYEATMESLH